MINFAKQTGRRKYLRPDKYLTTEQIGQLLASVRQEAETAKRNGATRGIRNCMLIELMLLTGLRKEEVCSLQLRDLPTHHHKDVILVRSGKGDLMRTVDVKTYLKKKLWEYIKLCRKGAKPGSPLFVCEKGQRFLTIKKTHKGKISTTTICTSQLSGDSLYKIIKRIGIQANLSGLHPHILRHTYGTHLHAIKKDLRLCQDQLGHSRTETTAIYAGVLDRDRKEQIENLFGPLFTNNIPILPVNKTL